MHELMSESAMNVFGGEIVLVDVFKVRHVDQQLSTAAGFVVVADGIGNDGGKHAFAVIVEELQTKAMIGGAFLIVRQPVALLDQIEPALEPMVIQILDDDLLIFRELVAVGNAVDGQAVDGEGIALGIRLVFIVFAKLDDRVFGLDGRAARRDRDQIVNGIVAGASDQRF